MALDPLKVEAQEFIDAARVALTSKNITHSASARALVQGITFAQHVIEPPAAGTPPTVTGLSPNSAVLGSPSFTLHVLGTGFVAGSTIVFAGNDEPSTLVSPTELTTGVNMAVWLGPDALPVLVRNPDGLVSAPMTFTFTAAAGATAAKAKA